MRQVLSAIVVLIGFTASASAAAIPAAPAESGITMLIGGGLILFSSIIRAKRRRR